MEDDYTTEDKPGFSKKIKYGLTIGMFLFTFIILVYLSQGLNIGVGAPLTGAPVTGVIQPLTTTMINYENEDMSGNLLISIQKKESGNWESYRKIYNESITVPAGEEFNLLDLFNDMGIFIEDPGKYRVDLEFLDKREFSEFEIKA
jgi:hypothetical protein|tara:strand:+ start:37 stop:474 length:438 start_codon:yes stop_codon:yes gene_type:complete